MGQAFFFDLWLRRISVHKVFLPFHNIAIWMPAFFCKDASCLIIFAYDKDAISIGRW